MKKPYTEQEMRELFPRQAKDELSVFWIAEELYKQKNKN